MKKKLMGILLLFIVCLVGCAKDKFAEPIENNTNKKIVTAFNENKLAMYSPKWDGPHEIDIKTEYSSQDSKPTSGLTFFTQKKGSNFENKITIFSFQTFDELEASDLYTKLTNAGIATVNKNINSIMFTNRDIGEKTFEQYKIIFDEIN
ncbi:hypothetical protein ACYSNW_01940 [Enterococcus sp. LJL99]